MASIEGHLVYKGFEAWVIVDGQSLPQFRVEYEESTRKVTAWIPSEAGKTFSICYRKRAGSDICGFEADIYLDGNYVSGIIHDKDYMEYSDVKTISFIRVSSTETRDFIFNPVELTDDDMFLNDSSAVEIGDIKIICCKAQMLANLPSEEYVFEAYQEIGKIHERSKKGVGHHVKFSECKTGAPYNPSVYSSKKLDDPVTFIFKYRPLEILHAKGIAPRSAEVNEDEDDDDDEIVGRERALLAELKQVRSQKRARKELERPVKRVKTEHKAQFLPGDVIDLTEEQEEAPNFTNREVIDLT